MKLLIFISAAALLTTPFCFAQTSSASGAQAPTSAYQNESQAAVVQTSGNTSTESLSFKQLSTYTHDKDTGKLTGSYLKTSTESVDTALKWDAGLRYERLFTERWSGFVGYSLESDRFSGFIQRNNADVGAKFQIKKSDKFDAVSEFGYRNTVENRVNENTDTNSDLGRVYIEGLYRLNETNAFKLWLEYLRDFEYSNYRANTEASISSAISTMFSLKVAYLINHDSGKQKDVVTGIRPDYTDTTLTTALVAKF